MSQNIEIKISKYPRVLINDFGLFFRISAFALSVFSHSPSKTGQRRDPRRNPRGYDLVIVLQTEPKLGQHFLVIKLPYKPIFMEIRTWRLMTFVLSCNFPTVSLLESEISSDCYAILALFYVATKPRGMFLLNSEGFFSAMTKHSVKAVN